MPADIQKHADQALTDRKAMVTEFAEQISGYAGITELNFKIINQLIEKILVSEPVEIDGQKIQRLTIHYKFIGRWTPLNNVYIDNKNAAPHACNRRRNRIFTYIIITFS